MGEKLKNFDIYNPVLSTHIVKVAPVIPTYQAPEIEQKMIKQAKIPKAKRKNNPKLIK